jgi:hypothetical protein
MVNWKGCGRRPFEINLKINLNEYKHCGIIITSTTYFLAWKWSYLYSFFCMEYVLSSL